ncbi:TonB-dependent receptor [Marivirga sp. S37H4]|uniref:TonB-dependent receptor n=1 Tax=Marivirga aurantiaca TaxID=2802615 RepID=A0A935C9Y5_9BACT|nr:TonB-dependent receptor [Marivirga aurantiaca]MBK6265887.1 TonB-dependent receptor [Marivirga aurantiaca]
MKTLILHIALLCIPVFLSSLGHAQGIKGKVLDAENQKGIELAEVFVLNSNKKAITNEAGSFELALPSGEYRIAAFYLGRQSEIREIVVNGDWLDLEFKLVPISETLQEVKALGKKEEIFNVSRLNAVEGTLIYEAKKNEVISIDQINGNLATNNARQVFAKVPGLNIWESDGGGLQLGIGGRGLNPNRTSNFNTRQNGYDISADPLGYPESYYTPPVEALSRIEVVRGAASLQYGTQFGGMINFLFKKAPEGDPFQFHTRNTVGSYGLFSSYNSLAGNTEKMDYFVYYQRKQGNGFRENESFEANTLFADVNFDIGDKLYLCFEFTHMDYLAQQAGGLTDPLFEQDPTQSVRERNWFAIQWNIPAVVLDYRISNRTKLNWKTFGLIGSRRALGNLDRVTQADSPEQERNLLWDDYENFGSELRILHRYDLFGQIQALAGGIRYFKGNTQQRQGLGPAGYEPDFRFLNPNNLEDLSYRYPSENVALFAENIFNINSRLSITPGLRWEYISTNSDGKYRETVEDLAGNVMFDTTVFESRNLDRSFMLAGLGISYKTIRELELYGNISMNYRGINFNDFRVNNGSLSVDPNLEDEKGYNIDFGFRGKHADFLNFDWSIFYLAYNNRLGAISDYDQFNRVFHYRTNVGSASIAGIESYTEMNWSQWLLSNPIHQFSTFLNAAFIRGRYGENNQENAIAGNKVELVPDLNIKTGINYDWKNFSSTLQFTYLSEQYTDATNALRTASGVDGIIPAFHVLDLSAKYKYKFAQLEAGVNNLTNNYYFTRRAVGYPGPGIIPSPGRNFYITLDLKF